LVDFCFILIHYFILIVVAEAKFFIRFVLFIMDFRLSFLIV
jgi:hypothetical protein